MYLIERILTQKYI